MQASKLMLVAGQAIDGAGPGLHALARVGRTQTFREHRLYSAGDDLRHLDWHVLARRDTMMVKVFEDEAPLRVELVVDSSGSMDYADKWQQAATLATAVARVALTTGEEVGLSTLGGADATPLLRAATAQKGRCHLRAIAQALAATAPAHGTTLAAALMALSHSLKRRSHIVVISDCWLPLAPLGRALLALKTRRHDVTLLQLTHPDEHTLPAVGVAQWRGFEGEQVVLADSEAARQPYLLRLATHNTTLAQWCGKSATAYLSGLCTDPLHRTLRAVLMAHKNRKSRAKNRYAHPF